MSKIKSQDIEALLETFDFVQLERTEFEGRWLGAVCFQNTGSPGISERDGLGRVPGADTGFDGQSCDASIARGRWRDRGEGDRNTAWTYRRARPQPGYLLPLTQTGRASIRSGRAARRALNGSLHYRGNETIHISSRGNFRRRSAGVGGGFQSL